MNFSLPAISLVLMLSLCSCSGTKKTNKKEFGMSYKERMSSADRALFHDDHSQRSSFEKHLGSDKKKKDVKMQAFKTRDFHSGKAFSGADDKFKTSNYNQSDKKSNVADKAFSGAGKQSSLGNDDYKTSESRFSHQSNSNNNKVSSLGDDEFRAKNDLEGTKAMEKSKRPFIEPRGEEGYSESAIHKLLNKD